MADNAFPPTGADVIGFLSWPTDAALEAQAAVHVKIVTNAVFAFTRGKGFSAGFANGVGMLNPVLASVIVSAAARSLSNPTGARRIEAGSYNEAPGSFAGFNLWELAALNGFRKTAA